MIYSENRNEVTQNSLIPSKNVSILSDKNEDTQILLIPKLETGTNTNDKNYQE